MSHTPIIKRVSREQAERAEGIVVVIDVMRAFTVAAYAFAGGAERLWLVKTVEEALALRERNSEALLAGEINGRLIPGFDLNNSPHMMSQADVRGKSIIQRTGAGTQGAVGAYNATYLLVTSLVTAKATAQYITQLSEATSLPITFLPTESTAEDIVRNEDKYCADYIEALITQPEQATAVLNERIARLHAEGRFRHWGKDKDEDFPVEDLAKILSVDNFNFVMPGKREEYAGFSYVELTQETLLA